MATAPDGSNFDASFFGSTGNGDGRSAANSMSGSSTKANALAYYKNMRQAQYGGWSISSSEWSAYDSGFSAGWDATLKSLSAYKTPGGLTPEQVQAQKEKAEEGKKTIEEWEQTADIPSWGVAKSVAANFDNDAMMFLDDVKSSATSLAMTPGGPAFLTKTSGFATQWKAVFTAINNQSVYTPSSAVAEVRKARGVMNALEAERVSLTKKPPAPVPNKPPVVITPDGTVVPPVGAKAKLPGWALLAGLIAAAGGIFLLFRKKKEPSRLPPGMPPTMRR